MIKKLSLTVKPAEAGSHQLLKNLIADQAGILPDDITGFNLLKKSIDARRKQVFVHLVLEAFIGEPWKKPEIQKSVFKDVSRAKKRVIIIGAGPAGLFAALKLLENGIKPVILERGKDVRARRRDLAVLNREGIINPESNYCFGEGGAGTYSDGKLYTRSTKRGDLNKILNLFVQFGAGEQILYESHPHIGTNKLPQIITSIRQQILGCGGEFNFEKKVTEFSIESGRIEKVLTADGMEYTGDAYILATGHSARDIFLLLRRKKIDIEFKPFAMGIRIEHPQELIDSIQYHCSPGQGTGSGKREPGLPPAAYSLTEQVDGRGVFSFCMCPGGIIAPASTNTEEVVVNGWSPSKRNNPFANSGIVVGVDEQDTSVFQEHGPLAGIRFQQETEQRAYRHGGGKLVAPAQRMTDFCERKYSASLPACSYLPGVRSTRLSEVLPDNIFRSISTALELYGKKMKGYYTSEAIVVAAESRTSSPVRIPRNRLTRNHPQLENLYPCGEGAGYAGGIVSAAIDGDNTAGMIINKFSSRL